MIEDILISPLGREFDVEQIGHHLASMSNAALDPVARRVYMIAGSGERIDDAIEARLADPGRFPYSVALVEPTPTRIDVSYRSMQTVEPARRFVQWLRSVHEVRITDEAFHDITDDCGDGLENIFGPRAASSLDLEPCSLADLGELRSSYARATLPCAHPVLVVRLEGAPIEGIDDVFDLMSAIIMAGLEAWQPSALVLDVRALAYSWGDRMQNVLDAPQRWYQPIRSIFSVRLPERFPLAVVTSELCRDGLASLVREEMGLDPAALLFESIDEAAAALDRVLERVRLP